MVCEKTRGITLEQLRDAVLHAEPVSRDGEWIGDFIPKDITFALLDFLSEAILSDM